MINVEMEHGACSTLSSLNTKTQFLQFFLSMIPQTIINQINPYVIRVQTSLMGKLTDTQFHVQVRHLVISR